MTLRTSIVIPVKGLRTGKSRLSHVLSDSDRFDLNCFLVRRTLQTVSGCRDGTDLHVVSPDPEVAEIAGEFSADFMLQETDGLNPGLEWAARLLPDRPTAYIAVDLPALEAADVRELIAATSIAICPDEKRQGTNAISMPHPRAFPFRFGTGSFDAHRALALRTGTPLREIERPGLTFDLDTESDLMRMKGWPNSINPRRV